MITLHHYHSWDDKRNYKSDMDLGFNNLIELRKYLRRVHSININDSLLNYENDTNEFKIFMINLRDLNNSYLNIELKEGSALNGN